jgi:ribosome assembly protein YihI (activator of Der GTPase)
MHWILLLALAFDLASVKSEPNLEKRSELALINANTALDSARDAYGQGDLDKTQANLDEVLDSVDLAYQALSDTGKDPRKDRFFKKAELKTRELLRRLEGLDQTMSFADRGIVDKVRDRVSEIHDNLLKGIMSKKKK